MDGPVRKEPAVVGSTTMETTDIMEFNLSQ